MGQDLNRNGSQSGYEASDADVKPILLFLVGLAVLIVATMGAMALLYNILESRLGRADREISPLIDTRQVPPEPRLQADPARELRDAVDWEESVLTGYGWVDRDLGVFRIPIDRAMEILVETGLPTRSPGGEE